MTVSPRLPLFLNVLLLLPPDPDDSRVGGVFVDYGGVIDTLDIGLDRFELLRGFIHSREGVVEGLSCQRQNQQASEGRQAKHTSWMYRARNSGTNSVSIFTFHPSQGRAKAI